MTADASPDPVSLLARATDLVAPWALRTAVTLDLPGSVAAAATDIDTLARAADLDPGALRSLVVGLLPRRAGARRRPHGRRRRPGPAGPLDLVMRMAFGGRERSQRDVVELAAQEGLAPHRSTVLPDGFVALELGAQPPPG